MAAIPGIRGNGGARSGRNGRAAVQPRVTAGANGASTGRSRPRTVERALPSGWGVARRRISATMIVALAMLTVAAVGLTQVLQTSHVAEVGYQLRALEDERTELDAQVRLLEARLAGSSNLERIREQAETRLGMVPAEDDLSITVNVPAPDVVPLPRRYVDTPEQLTLPESTWWEELIGTLPGFD